MAKPTGEIYLLKNVLLNPTYEHTFDFKDKTEQFSYFMNFTSHHLTNYRYIKKEREFINVELPVDSINEINYLIFRSEDNSKLYYAFVMDKLWLSESSSTIVFEIDVMQTYMFDYKFQPTYIKQSHVDRWDASHKPIYSKTDEGLDYGDEYLVEKAFNIEQSRSVQWLLISTTSYSELVEEGFVTEGGDIFPAPSPFALFLIPLSLKVKEDGTPVSIRVGKISNAVDETGYLNVAHYGDLIKLMLNSAIGNYIKSISLLTYNPFVINERLTTEQTIVDFSGNVRLRTCVFKDAPGKQFLVLDALYNDYLNQYGRTLARADWNIGLEDALPTSAQWGELAKNPYTTKRDKRFESKLLCYPYRYNLLTDWRNNPVVLKNEYMTTDKIDIRFSYALSYNAPFRYWLKDYKKDIEGRNNSLTQPLALDFPIISDAYYTYMLENKNQIQANLTNSIINSTAGVVSSFASGSPMAVAGSAVNGVLNVAQTIRNENAKQKDLQAKPDSIINSNDSSFNVIDKNTNISFYRMRLSCEQENILSEIFNMSGYKVNRVDIPNTKSRTRFNYIQTQGANIEGSFNQSDLLKIKNIYNQGVTIWHFNNVNFKPFDYSLENVEVNLVVKD